MVSNTSKVLVGRVGVDTIQQAVLEWVDVVDRDRRSVERIRDVDDRIVARRETGSASFSSCCT
jgi:hypothetical protein